MPARRVARATSSFARSARRSTPARTAAPAKTTPPSALSTVSFPTSGRRTRHRGTRAAHPLYAHHVRHHGECTPNERDHVKELPHGKAPDRARHEHDRACNAHARRSGCGRDVIIVRVGGGLHGGTLSRA